MTTATRRVPVHGSTARYKGAKNRPPCRCRTCLDGHNRAGQFRKLRRSAGLTGYIPAAPIRAHIQTLLDSGMSQSSIGRLAKVSPSTVNRILDPSVANCFRIQAKRILAVPPHRYDGPALRPTLGTVRRVRGLYAHGHSAVTIAAHSGLAEATIQSLASAERTKTAATTEAAVRTACRFLITQPGRSDTSRKRAQLAGWAPIAAWDDIDNPACQPERDDIPEVELKRGPRADERKEEIRLLSTAGIPTHEIAGRVGLAPGTVRQLIQDQRTGAKRDRKKVPA